MLDSDESWPKELATKPKRKTCVSFGQMPKTIDDCLYSLKPDPTRIYLTALKTRLDLNHEERNECGWNGIEWGEWVEGKSVGSAEGKSKLIDS